MEHKIKKICVIGGSTSGWWTAGYFEKHFPDMEIAIYDAPRIPALGVGESTLPQLKWWWEELGIDEKDWVQESNAVLKYGNYKEGWNSSDFDKPFVTRFWFNDNNKFDDMMKDPSYFDDDGNIIHQKFYDEFDRPDSRADYAYHVCAEASADIVKRKCKRTILIEEEVDELPEGYDLYIDATGFNRKFVKDKTSMEISPYHFVDSAWVCPMEKSDKDADVTKSIARKYGWSFEVNLKNRVGMGYIFSSKHVSDADALAEFEEIYKKENRIPKVRPRKIKWKPMVLQNPWSDNVVAIGTSAGFVDPLEATALFMTQSGITQLANTIKRGYTPRAYNAVMRRVWNDGLRFQIAHYTMSNRKDTKFWLDSKKGRDDKFIWENYKKYTSSYQWIFPSGVWCQLGVYFNDFQHYEPKTI